MARMEGFRALKLSELENYSALKFSRLESLDEWVLYFCKSALCCFPSYPGNQCFNNFVRNYDLSKHNNWSVGYDPQLGVISFRARKHPAHWDRCQICFNLGYFEKYTFSKTIFAVKFLMIPDAVFLKTQNKSKGKKRVKLKILNF